MKDFITNYISDSIKTKESILSNTELVLRIEKASKLIIESYKNGGKVLTAGNGGSAADAQHIAAEFAQCLIGILIPFSIKYTP